MKRQTHRNKVADLLPIYFLIILVTVCIIAILVVNYFTQHTDGIEIPASNHSLIGGDLGYKFNATDLLKQEEKFLPYCIGNNSKDMVIEALNATCNEIYGGHAN